MNKKRSQAIHAIRRLKERYGLNEEDYYHIVRLIRDQHKREVYGITFVGRESNRRTLWEVVYKSKRILAVYDTERGNIITFLHT